MLSRLSRLSVPHKSKQNYWMARQRRFQKRKTEFSFHMTLRQCHKKVIDKWTELWFFFFGVMIFRLYRIIRSARLWEIYLFGNSNGFGFRRKKGRKEGMSSSCSSSGSDVQNVLRPEPPMRKKRIKSFLVVEDFYSFRICYKLCTHAHTLCCVVLSVGLLRANQCSIHFFPSIHFDNMPIFFCSPNGYVSSFISVVSRW